jgi:hypothetical protein
MNESKKCSLFGMKKNTQKSERASTGLAGDRSIRGGNAYLQRGSANKNYTYDFHEKMMIRGGGLFFYGSDRKEGEGISNSCNPNIPPPHSAQHSAFNHSAFNDTINTIAPR